MNIPNGMRNVVKKPANCRWCVDAGTSDGFQARMFIFVGKMAKLICFETGGIDCVAVLSSLTNDGEALSNEAMILRSCEGCSAGRPWYLRGVFCT